MYSYDRRKISKLSPRQRAWERRKEQDERARYNIPPEYQRAWDRLKSRFKGNPDQRAERFMEYMEENPTERDEILQEGADKDIARMVREQKREYQRMERERKKKEQAEKRRQRELEKMKKLEQECDKRQTQYEDAWYKEQERQTKEKNRLKKLQEKAESICEICPTCDEYKSEVENDPDEMVPFAASLHAKVASRWSRRSQAT